MRHCVQAAFGGRRIVVFSGGAAKGEDAVYDDARAIRDGGGNGSIIGRNTFQRSRADALAMLGKLVEIYKGRGIDKSRGNPPQIRGFPSARAIWHARPEAENGHNELKCITIPSRAAACSVRSSPSSWWP